MYPPQSATSLPPLALHLGNLPGFEFSSDRETPISNPPSGVFSVPSAASSALSSTSISPLSLLSATPVNQPTPVCHRQGLNHVFQRAATFPLANPATLTRVSQPQSVLPEGFQKCSFVDSLVDTGALIIETIWPNQTLPILNSKVLPLRVFIQETIRRSRTSFFTLQLALYYLLRIKSAVIDFETKNPEWFHGPCNFGRTASKHPIACGRRMFLAAVIVASKYLQDRNYSNRAWAKISGLPVKEINANEFVFLNVAKYDLYVGDALFKRWSNVLLNHVMATVSITSAASGPMTPSVGLPTPPLTPIMSPTSLTSTTLPVPKALRIALAQRFCDAIHALSPQLSESELASLHVLGFQSPQQKPMSPPPSRNGLGQTIRSYGNLPSFPLNPCLSQSRVPSSYETSPPTSSDSASDSDGWSPRSSVSSASSNDSTTNNISPRANLGRTYLKTLGCPLRSVAATTAVKSQTITGCLAAKRCASPLSIIAACNDRKRNHHPISDSPVHMEDVRPTTPQLPTLEETSLASSEDDQDWSSTAGTIDPKLLQLNSSALTAIKGLCDLSQRATVFESPLPPPPGMKRTFSKSYSMGSVQSEDEFVASKRRRGALSDQTLARLL